jgi:exportin-1
MTTSVAEAGQRLLQDDQPFDVAVLDGIVAAAYEPRHPERATANEILMKLREKPGCWQAADQIIEKSSLPQGRYFGLMALDDAINTRWKILPEGQRTGIKNFIVNKIISLSKDEESSMRERTMIHQMNKVLVSILKQEWPHNWPSFIGDICGASKNSEILCENNMHILRLLSEEVFDFSKDSMTTVCLRRPDAVFMKTSARTRGRDAVDATARLVLTASPHTQAKIRTLKESLNTEFAEIFKLCIFVLGASSRPQLISATLRTLKAFLSWIPLGYLFETDLIRTLIERFFAAAQFRNAALECLTEIASLADLEPKYDPKIIQLYVGVLQALGQVVPPNASLASAFEATGREADQTFVRRLALFFSGFFKAHLRLVETREQGPLLLDGLNYLVRISAVPDNEVFQICLDFWHAFAQDLYATETGRSAPRPGGYGNDDTFEPPVTSEGPGGVASRFGGRPIPASSSSSTAGCCPKLD